MKTSGGHDWGDPNLDWLGLFYITLAIVTTGLVAIGLILLYFHRESTAVRLRGFWNICITVLLLLGYLLLVLLVYPLNGLFKCDLEFFVMSIFLPLGIALFQACNIRLLYYYNAQQELAEVGHLDEKQRAVRRSQQSLSRWWLRRNTLEKTHTAIALGILLQIGATVFLYISSRNFHAGYGIFNTYQGPGECRRGLEWLPSVAWQFLWSTVFGPYVLLRTRHIRDTHYWALQTRLAVLSCLPGTPLWLAFVYSDSPALTKINQWFVPAGWFLPGLYTMIFICIYFPLFDDHRDKKIKRMSRSTADNLAILSKEGSSEFTSRESSKDFVSMAALERQLSKNIDPLLQWAAQKEFTAENIVFLRAVRDFKKKWNLAAKRNPLDESQVRDRFEEAALIYFTLVNPATAKFNINIDYGIYQPLAQLFTGLKYEPFESDPLSPSSAPSENVIAPWANSEGLSSLKSPTYEDPPVISDIDKLYPLPVTEIKPVDITKDPDLSDKRKSLNGLSIPIVFTIDIFDRAYDSVKQDVFFNTWMRFEASQRGLQYV